MRPVVVLAALLVGCEAPPETTPAVSSPPKPGQKEAVEVALAAYGLPASTPVPIVWVEAECVWTPGLAADVCTNGYRSVANGQIVIAWHKGATHVRDARYSLAHEIAHIVSQDEMHGCSSEQDPEWVEHKRCGDFWGVGGVVDAVTVAIGAMP